MDNNSSLLTALNSAVTEDTSDKDSVLVFCQEVTNAYNAHNYELVAAKLGELNDSLDPSMFQSNDALGSMLSSSVRGVETMVRLFLHVNAVTPLGRTEAYVRISAECTRLGSMLDFSFGSVRIKKQFSIVAHHK